MKMAGMPGPRHTHHHVRELIPRYGGLNRINNIYYSVERRISDVKHLVVVFSYSSLSAAGGVSHGRPSLVSLRIVECGVDVLECECLLDVTFEVRIAE